MKSPISLTEAEEAKLGELLRKLIQQKTGTSFHGDVNLGLRINADGTLGKYPELSLKFNLSIRS